MPNHVENNLNVFGDVQDVQAFRKLFVIEKDGVETATYNLIYPMPPQLNAEVSPLPKRDGETDEQYKSRMKRYKKEYGFDNWYDWRIANWKTKWDVYDFNLYLDESDNIECTFSSAWSPPIGWLEKAIQMFPNLHFRMDYMDEGDNYCGMAVGIDGEMADQEAAVEYQDDNGNKVKWDSSIERWKTTNKALDEDFYPNRINPLV